MDVTNISPHPAHTNSTNNGWSRRGHNTRVDTIPTSYIVSSLTPKNHLYPKEVVRIVSFKATLPTSITASIPDTLSIEAKRKFLMRGTMALTKYPRFGYMLKAKA